MTELNPHFSHLACTFCGAQYPKDHLINLCPHDQRPVQAVYDTTGIQATQWYHPERKDLWRFAGLLPMASGFTSHGEGYTPLLDHSSHALAKKHGFQLFIKDEGKGHKDFGQNPTLSFKDRGMAVVINMAKHFGVAKLAVPTQGNAGDSLAFYANEMGIGAVVIMPDDTPAPIQGNVAALAFHNPDIKLEMIKGTIKEAGLLMKEKYLPQGYFNVATFQEPGWRIEGKKTMGLELAEPNRLSEQWALPNVILYPTGGGTGILGMWKAFDELEAMGMIDSQRPKIIAVQSAATPPVKNAIDKDLFEPEPTPAGETLAVGLNVAGGVGHFKVVDIVRQSGGTSIAISEADIAKHLSEIWQDKHWWVCPEGAACLAALKPLIDMNMIKPKDQVVVFNTGSFEKYLPEVRHLL
ncbi:threonine synthase [Marinicella litoralis]|uniref:Threonine synthase n=1 Tax=Marinicella litoralis TaxID=644220 RepID=A0A4R6XYG1_9GAMM|nr:threonine synthase [Marinicella litoralis]TDR23679.1 threonine synthase [Marinicella litoralis]